MYHKKEVNEVLKELNANQDGLSKREALQRLEKYGRNEIQRFKKVSPFKMFISQFKSFIIYVLLAAALLSIFLGEKTDAIVILAIVILNALFGFFQEFKAEKSIESLRKLSAPTALVIRDGKTQKIPSAEVVPGDIIVIEEGCYIPADARLIEIASLKIDESTLTGESVPVSKSIDIIKKDTVISNQKNMLFAGTIATMGRGKAVVVATASNTELGKIAREIQHIGEKQTPLQKKLQSLGINITIAILVIALIIFILGFLRGSSLIDSLLVAVALAVAAIPEGLPAVVTITLAIGTQRMLKKNALVRRLSAVESLGSVTVICSDKTGTLTKNEMTVTRVYANNKLISVTGRGYETIGEFFYDNKKVDAKELEKLMQIAKLCNNASLDGHSDPTEKALLVAAKKSKYEKDYKRLKEIPFSSETKFMTTLNKIDNEEIFNMKGAPEIVLEKCNKILLNNREIKLTKQHKDEILNVYEKMASDALRVLGFAYSMNNKDYVFVGLMGMIDPPREGVKEAIASCETAGIRVIMITGDYAATAKAIAKEIEIKGEAITGDEIDKLTSDELAKSVDKFSIFARVDPQHKVKILDALKKNKQVVAMTGDGVNDAVALKKSDVGISVGSGTDVAKEASDIVLLDDNFVTVANAVKEGRGIYDNIKKSIGYLFSCNLAEVAVIFFALLIGLPIPLIAIQILAMNLITDGLPALALGVDKINEDVMNKKPRNPSQNIVTKKDLLFFISQAFVITVLTLGLFVYYLNKNAITNLIYVQTIAFSSLVLFELFNAVNYHSGGISLFKKGLFSNKHLVGANIISFLIQLLIVYVLVNVFKTTPLLLIDWVFILTAGIIVVVVQETIKLFIKPDY